MSDEQVEGGHAADAAITPIDAQSLRCSFCGKAYSDVETMVCGPTPSVAICEECVELCTEIMAEDRSGPTQAA